MSTPCLTLMSLGAKQRLYKRLCWSVGRSVGPSVPISLRKLITPQFLCAWDQVIPLLQGHDVSIYFCLHYVFVQRCNVFPFFVSIMFFFIFLSPLCFFSFLYRDMMFFSFLSPLCFLCFVEGHDVFHFFCPHYVFFIFVQGHDVFLFFSSPLCFFHFCRGM